MMGDATHHCITATPAGVAVVWSHAAVWFCRIGHVMIVSAGSLAMLLLVDYCMLVVQALQRKFSFKRLSKWW
jgi:hypothetical protein